MVNRIELAKGEIQGTSLVSAPEGWYPDEL
jgi:hypothetical protein